MNTRCAVVIYERTGRWAVALRQTLSRAASAIVSNPHEPRDRDASRWAGDIRLVETRSSDECLAVLADAPQAIVLLELAAATCDTSLALLRAISDRFPAARAVVMADRELSSYEWLARELGAVHFVSSPRQLPAVLGLAEAHWRSLPEPEIEIAEGMWASLPWE